MNPNLPKDHRDFVELLNRNEVKYVLLGGWAVGIHGHPRFTKDIDFFFDRSEANVDAIWRALEQFGLPSPGFERADLLEENSCAYFGHPPYRIDLLNFADGITFEEAWRTRQEIEFDGLTIKLISRELLIANKRATGRGQDAADAEILERRK